MGSASATSHLLQLLEEYLDEVEALIEADDWEVFDGAFLRKHGALREAYDDLGPALESARRKLQ